VEHLLNFNVFVYYLFQTITDNSYFYIFIKIWKELGKEVYPI